MMTMGQFQETVVIQVARKKMGGLVQVLLQFVQLHVEMGSSLEASNVKMMTYLKETAVTQIAKSS